MKKSTNAIGQARFDTEHDSKYGHGDHWWAYCLAEAAANQPTSHLSDGYLAGTAIGLSISPTPHDWYYLTSPVIDLSMYATSTYLDYTTNWAYDHSMIFEFSWWANLAEVGETAKLEFSGDGKTWVTVGDTLLNVQMASWKYAYQWPYTGTNNGNEIIPKALLTKSFQFRIGYKVDSVDALIPLVSGISIDRPEIWVGTCWD